MPATPNGSPDAPAPPAGRVRWRDSLRTRMVLWSSVLNAGLLLVTALAFYFGARWLIVQNARAEADGLARQTVRSLEATLESVQVSGRTLAASATGVGAQPSNLRSLLVASLAGDPDIAGAMIIIEPGLLPGDPDGFTWYIRRDGPTLVEQSVADLGYDYATMPWYVRTVASPRPWWSEPYANAATAGEYFSTYNLPLWRPGDPPGAPAVGMVSLDVPVARLAELVTGISGAGLQPMLFSPEGLAVVHPDPDVQMRLGAAELAARPGRGDLAPLAAAIAERRPATFEHRDAGRNALGTVVVPVADSGWSFALTASDQHFLHRLDRVAVGVALASLIALLFALWLARRYSGAIAAPIEELTDSAHHFSEGDFDYPLPYVERGDEVGVMARAFDAARGSIKEQMQEIGEMASARQKLESELSIARDIQQSMLPAARAFDTRHMHVEAHAVLEPATAVGGDFYQFSELEPGVLWFAIGDVSDKGIPAALFMARTLTVLEQMARRHGTPEKILAAASVRLAENNDTCMFATVLCGRLDVASGRLRLASAGHEPPLLLHADGRAELLALAGGAPLGFEPSDDYPLHEGVLAAGATLVGYTDGVTEAFDADNRAYGSERLLRVLAAGDDAETACRRLLEDVRAHAGEAPQSDDITILAISRARDLDSAGAAAHAVATQGETSVRIDGARTHADVLRMTDAVDALLARHGASAAAIHDARLVVEEVACNVVEHAIAPDAPLQLQAHLDGDRLRLEFRDRGAPFDPTARDAPDLDLDIAVRGIGGLGVFLVRELADAVDYQRIDGCNVLRITLRLDAAHDMESQA
ncbi:SpoIIE family protein phosphatase [Pseudoxanthomonas suwonensis]|uniref:SpoIIE family protein phosphatase n=1 Tax=Pseudoxanthomonas suwonensis TaxID=314722 RepID=UPI0009E2D636|nr:SpoIIE family protein phosphatase [Pseudoxanthomonas suwonensis]